MTSLARDAEPLFVPMIDAALGRGSDTNAQPVGEIDSH